MNTEGNPRLTEARALLECAKRLAHARNNIKDYKCFADSLRFNQDFWTIIQADLTLPTNPLPIATKQNLLRLSVFIDKHTWHALANPSAEVLDVLIDINRDIAQGLLDSVRRSEQSTESPSKSSEKMA